MAVNADTSLGQGGADQSLDMGGKTLLTPGRFFDDMFFNRILKITGLQKGDDEARRLRRFFLGDCPIYDFDILNKRMLSLPEKLQNLVDIFRTAEDVRKKMAMLPANENHEVEGRFKSAVSQNQPTSLIEIINISQPIIEQLQALVGKV